MAINPLSGTAVQQAIFKAADKDKSGKLTGAEFAQALKAAQGRAPTPTEQAAALKELDANKDGGVDLAEFERANVAAFDSIKTLKAQQYAAAFQSAGIATSNAGANIYAQVLGGSLNGTFNSTGTLVGQLVGGSVTSKLV